jgi:hypothetical protein
MFDIKKLVEDKIFNDSNKKIIVAPIVFFILMSIANIMFVSDIQKIFEKDQPYLIFPYDYLIIQILNGLMCVIGIIMLFVFFKNNGLKMSIYTNILPLFACVSALTAIIFSYKMYSSENHGIVDIVLTFLNSLYFLIIFIFFITLKYVHISHIETKQNLVGRTSMSNAQNSTSQIPRMDPKDNPFLSPKFNPQRLNKKPSSFQSPSSFRLPPIANKSSSADSPMLGNIDENDLKQSNLDLVQTPITN